MVSSKYYLQKVSLIKFILLFESEECWVKYYLLQISIQFKLVIIVNSVMELYIIYLINSFKMNIPTQIRNYFNYFQFWFELYDYAITLGYTTIINKYKVDIIYIPKRSPPSIQLELLIKYFILHSPLLRFCLLFYFIFNVFNNWKCLKVFMFTQIFFFNQISRSSIRIYFIWKPRYT